MKVWILHTLIFFFWTFSSGTLASALTGEKIPVSKEMILLSVAKSTLRAELRTLPENGDISRALRSFKIAVGKSDGDKEKEGDNKTPEGIYFTVGKIEGSKLTPDKYGPLALPLNFPNPIDQMDSKTGHGIWLHGVGDRNIEDAKVTEGCVAFPNDQIRDLADWLKPSHGVVVIAKDLSEVNRASDVASVLETSRSWIQAWMERDVARYISYYHPGFENAGRNKKAYQAYKEAVFKSYKEMKISVNNVRVVTHPKYALVMMDQDFQGDKRFRSDGRKLLYWRRDEGGQWKIARELFDNLRMTPVQFNTSDIGTGQQGTMVTPVGGAAANATGHVTKNL